jgi:hypothetical protein
MIFLFIITTITTIILVYNYSYKEKNRINNINSIQKKKEAKEVLEIYKGKELIKKIGKDYIDIFENGSKIKTLVFSNQNENIISKLIEYSPQTGKKTRAFFFKQDGKTVNKIEIYNFDSENNEKNGLIKIYFFDQKGQNIKSIQEFLPQKSIFQPIKIINFEKNNDNKIISITEYNINNLELRNREIYFLDDGTTIKEIIYFDESGSIKFNQKTFEKTENRKVDFDLSSSLLSDLSKELKQKLEENGKIMEEENLIFKLATE